MKPHYNARSNRCHVSNLTKYCACHAERLTYLVLITYETSFTVRGATGVTIQPHQILRLPRKMTRLLYRPHIWNVISNARSNSVTIQPHQILRLPRKMTLQDFKENLQKQMKRHFQCGADPSMIRPLSDQWKRKPQPASQVRLLFVRAHHEHFLLNNTTFRAQSYIQTFTKYCACHVKCHLNFTKYCACHAERLTYLVLIAYETSFTVRGATGVTIQPHQILRLPRKMTRLLYRPHIWNVISNARSNMVSPSNLTKYCACHEKWLDCFIVLTYETSFPMREQQVSLSNLTKYCACHEKWHCKISKKISKNRWKRHFQCGADPTMIRAWIRAWKRKRKPASQVRLLFELTTSIFYWKIQRFAPILHSNLHQILRLPRKVPLELHQKLRLPRKVTLWNFTKYCACHEKWHLNFTKYCAGHCTVTELYCTLLYLTLLYVTLLYVTLLYVTLLYLTLLYLTLLYLTLLDTTLRDTTLRDTTLLDSTLLDSTLLDSTWHYSTWHYSTWLLFYLTLLYLTCSTWLNFTEMLFVYRKFLT